jgi:hypothetical protein
VFLIAPNKKSPKRLKFAPSGHPVAKLAYLRLFINSATPTSRVRIECNRSCLSQDCRLENKVARFFKPKIPIWVNFGRPWNGKGWLYYFAIWNTSIWHNLWPFGNLVANWYISSRFGFLYQEKSGNPALESNRIFFSFFRKKFSTFFPLSLYSCTDLTSHIISQTDLETVQTSA